MARLTISNRRERVLVTAADALLLPAALGRVLRRRPGAPPARVLCLRLERIGDLLLTLPALAALRAAVPGASIDLVVGSWNRDLAGAIPGIDRVETLDAAWLTRAGAGLHTAAARPSGGSLAQPPLRSRDQFRARHPHQSRACGQRVRDGRSDSEAAAAARCWTTRSITIAAMHTSDNALALVRAAVGEPPAGAPALLAIPDAHRAEAARLLVAVPDGPRIGVHVSGGRAIKQWPVERFREVAERLVCQRGAAIVLTGTPEERAQVEAVRTALPPDRVLDVSSGVNLLTAAAVLQQIDLLVTGDTGPMHLAHAVGTPVVAIFGPSDPRRYAPRGLRDHIVRIDLPCSPCNRIRRPPARCVGHTPDCLSGIDVARVLRGDRRGPRAGGPVMRSTSTRAPDRGGRLCSITWSRPTKSARTKTPARGSRPPASGVDGTAFRSRFTLRGDSLWWFAELYLHKEQAIHLPCDARGVRRAGRPRAAARGPARERPPSGGRSRARLPAGEVRHTGPDWPQDSSWLTRMEMRATALAAGARLSRLRTRPAPRARGRVAAFVHRAFWRADGADGRAEVYIGPILREIETRLTPGDVRYVGVGPRTNFRARRWWDALRTGDERGIVPIERYAPASALKAARQVFRERHAIRRPVMGEPAIRAHAVIRGVDCWPLVREQLAGIALLQFPWSARAMDEAAAALDALAPEVAVTYAEAGGWGRAIALEARRRGVPLAGLQHGFVYRHWLNYRHEPDEMRPDPANAADRGFPLPAATLLFDEHTPEHLARAGGFPEDAMAVTGSARFDDLASAMAALQPADIQRARRDAGATGDQMLIVFAGKEREARRVLPGLIAAVGTMPAVQLAIKPHPAETPAVYAAAAAGTANVRDPAGGRAASAAARRGGRRRHRQLHGGDRRRRAGRPGAGDRPAEQPVALRGARDDAGRQFA